MSNISFIELAEDIVIEIMTQEEFYTYDVENSDLESYNVDEVTDDSSIEEILVFMLYDGHKNNFSRTHKIIESDNSDLSMSTKNLMKSLMTDISDLYFEISQTPSSANYQESNISNNKRKQNTTKKEMMGKTKVLNKVRRIAKKHKQKIKDEYNIY